MMMRIIFIMLILCFCTGAKAQLINCNSLAPMDSKHTGLNIIPVKFSPAQKYITYANATLLKKKEKRTTLYIGLGIVSEFPKAGSNEVYQSQFLASANFDFKFFEFFHLNTGIDAIAGSTSKNSAVLICVIPEFAVCDNNFELLFGFGAFLATASSGEGGIGGGLLPSFRFNYFVSKNMGIGLELKHPTVFIEENFALMSTLGVNFKL